MADARTLEGGSLGRMTASTTGVGRWGWLLVKVALSASVLALVFSAVEWSALVQALSSTEWMGLVIAAGLLPLQLGFRMLRWRTLLRSVGAPPNDGDVARTILSGYALGVVTPAEVGDVALRMEVHDEHARTRVAGLVVLEKLTHSLLALVPGLPALVLALTNDIWMALVATALMAVSVGILMKRHHALRRLQLGDRWPRLRPLDEALAAMSDVPPLVLRRVMLWTCGILAVYVVQEYALLNAVTTLGVVGTWNGFWAGIGLRTLAPIFVMDLGIREASHVLFFGRYGIEPAVATTVSLLMFAVNVLLPTLAGVMVFLTDRRRRR